MSGRCDQCGHIGEMWCDECAYPDLALYKEAAEAWAKEQVVEIETRITSHYDGMVRVVKTWSCDACGAACTASQPTHTADCKAARILGLKREGSVMEPERIWYNDTPESEREYYDTRKGWDDARCEHCGEPFWGYERDEACDRCKDWRPTI